MARVYGTMYKGLSFRNEGFSLVAALFCMGLLKIRFPHLGAGNSGKPEDMCDQSCQLQSSRHSSCRARFDNLGTRLRHMYKSIYLRPPFLRSLMC